MPSQFDSALATFAKNNGILRSSEARRQGINPATLARMAQAGLLVRETRGVYRTAELPPLRDPDLTLVTLRAPRGVICLISALYFHDLTTQIPHQVYVALPRGHKAPHIAWPPAEFVWVREPAYSAGIETHMFDDVPVHIYSAEKTVADCFKFRNTIGVDIAVEALKDYLRRPNSDMNKLTQYARENHVYTLMHPYIQGLLALLLEVR